MEIEGEDGTKTQLEKGYKKDLGRGLAFDSNDRTISRRHISFELEQDENQTNSNSKFRVYFEVLGRNPIWVRSSGDGKIRVYRRFQTGEMDGGDMFCVSAKNPNWFTLKTVKIEGEEDGNGMERDLGCDFELGESLESGCGLKGVEDLELGHIDLSNIDPVKEFGFLVMGHEFDNYPKKMMRDAKTWDWFLEEFKVESEDEGARVKRKKTHGNDDDDDDWTGESEEDKELISKSRKIPRPRYSTSSKEKSTSNKSAGKKTNRGNEEDETDEEDEDDETLGGFIVDEDDAKEEEKESDGEEEEEEEEEDDFDEDE